MRTNDPHEPSASKSSPKSAARSAARARGLFRDALDLAKLWPDLRPQRRLIYIAAALIPIISLLQMSFPLVLKYTVDQGIVAGDGDVVTLGAGLFLGIVVVEYVVRAIQSILSSLAVHRMVRAMRMRLIGHILDLSCSYHDRSMSGALVTRATGDFDNLSESLNLGVLTSIVDVAVLIGCLAGMFALDVRLALFALVLVPLVGWMVHKFSVVLKASMLKARVKIAALNAYTQECLYGNSTIKVLAAEKSATARYGQLNVDYRNAQMGSVMVDAVMFSVLDGLAQVVIGIVLWLAVRGLFGDSLLAAHGLSAGILVAFTLYVQQLFEPLKQLGNKIAMLQGVFTSIERIFGVLSLDDRIGGQLALPHLRGAVSFRHVSFSYRKDAGEGDALKDAILRDVHFELEPGKSLAIVGATGSGKSTIVKLIAKLYDGYQGSILIDGHELATLAPQQLRRQLAIVPQDIVLFDGSLAFNIALGQADVSRADVAEALAQLGAGELLQRLPGGLDAEIREKGANLSHGQRQIIAFARALVRKPGLVILDEATSSVDPEAEAQVQRATKRLLSGRSVIVIAHRLSTIRQCDEILVMSKGVVLERGDHAALLKAEGAYFKLHHALV